MTESVTQTGGGWTDARVLLPGVKVADRYRVERFIASGGMGEVYEVTDEALSERVALKVLRKPGGPRLEDEARLARRVTHANVCRVYDLGRHGELQFITMELLRGQTLAALLRQRKRLPAAEVRRLADAVCAGLRAAHEAGVVHGDLKPGNVMLTESGRIVVTDFGLARGNEASSPSDYGSPGYVSPEQVTGLPLGPASDIYSLGVMVFELLTGELPFRGGSAQVTARLRLDHAPDISRLPRSFRAEVSACLAVDPALRPPRPSFTPPRRWRRAALVVLGALSLAGLSWALTLPQRPVFVPREIQLRVELDPPDPWLSRAAKSLLGRQLNRTHWVKVGANGVPLTVSITAEGDRFRVAAKPLTSRHAAVAPSIKEAFAALLPEILPDLGASGPAPASQAELNEMARAGARDLDAFRAYVEADAYWETEEIDSEALAQSLEKALERDPGWSRLWAKLIAVNGMHGPHAVATLQRAKAAAVTGRDPPGDDLLRAIDLLHAGNTAGVVDVILPLERRWSDDMLFNWVLGVAFYRLGRLDELSSAEQRQMELRPDLQFGTNFIASLFNAGREREVPAFLEAWVERAPDNKQALLASAFLASNRGDAEASSWIARTFQLHGVAPGDAFAAARVFIGLEKYGEARRSVAALSGQGPRWASYAQWSLGTISVLEGRLGSARDTLLPALEMGRPFGLESLTMQILVSLARLDRLAGRTGDAKGHLEDLARTVKIFGDPALATAVAVEAQLVSDGGCAPVQPALHAMRAPNDLTGRRYLTRVAARHGCLDCAAVMKEGLGLKEPSNESLLIYGRCAAELGELPVARRALERAARLMTVVGGRLEFESSFDSVMARYELARVAERQGNVAEAVGLYRSFLRWEGTEVSVPELASARAALSRLAP